MSDTIHVTRLYGILEVVVGDEEDLRINVKRELLEGTELEQFLKVPGREIFTVLDFFPGSVDDKLREIIEGESPEGKLEDLAYRIFGNMQGAVAGELELNGDGWKGADIDEIADLLLSLMGIAHARGVNLLLLAGQRLSASRVPR